MTDHYLAPDDEALRQAYHGKRVAIFGGDGFLGSYTALALHQLGAIVTLYSRREQPLLNHLDIHFFRGDMLSSPVLEQAIQGQDILFDLAGSSGGVESNQNATTNLNKECAPHLNLFEIAARQAKPPLIFFCSTRTVYGKAEYLPVNEAHPVRPHSIYAAHKLTLENYLEVFHKLHDLPYVIFRLSNPYGPFPWQMGKAYGILNQFILKAHRGEPLTIFGDGEQLRDYIYIDDVITPILKAAITPECRQQTYNLGGPAPISMREAVEKIVKRCPQSEIIHQDWPEDYKSIETGDYTTDGSALSKAIDWQPQTSFDEGLAKTLDVYQKAPVLTKGKTTSPAPPTTPPNDFSWQGKRVLITGASGSLGSFTAQVLIDLGAQVIAMHRSPMPEWLDSDQLKSSHLFDLTNSTAQIEAVFENEKPQIVFHFASHPDGQEEPEDIIDRLNTNTYATLDLLKCSHEQNVEAFVMADSCKVYGNSPLPHREQTPISPETSYAATKYTAWALCRIYHQRHNLPVTSLRPTLIYGPGQAFNLFSYLGQCVTSGKEEISLAGGDQTRDPVYIADAVRAYLLAASNISQLTGRALPIGGGDEKTVASLAQGFVDAAHHSATIVSCPKQMRPGEMLRSFCDNIDTNVALDWKPEVNIDQGLTKVANYLLANQDDKHRQLRECQQATAESITTKPKHELV